MSRTLPILRATVPELQRLGLLRSPIGRDLDEALISNALREAFGDDSWHELSNQTLMERLRAGSPPRGVRGQRRPRYAALTTGGVLECVMAFGFNDGPDAAAPPLINSTRPVDTPNRLSWLAHQLCGRGYLEGVGEAIRLLAQRNRRPQENDCTRYFSRRAALSFSPPVGPQRMVDVVVRLIANIDGQHGDTAAAAFLDGLQHAPVCVYAGHARYGLGPDFESALPIHVSLGAPLPPNPHRLAHLATREARSRNETMECILDRWLNTGWIQLRRSNDSRITLSSRNVLPKSLTARLTHWVASRAPGSSDPVTGPTGRLAHAFSDLPHRLWLLLCCRSELLFQSIRRTEGLDSAALRLVGVGRDSHPPNLLAFPLLLDALCAECTWEQILRALDDRGYSQSTLGRIIVDGWDEDPVIP